MAISGYGEFESSSFQKYLALMVCGTIFDRGGLSGNGKKLGVE
jgi:hypothetical protein